MKKIFKYELQVTDSQTITMPKGAQIISAQVQNNKPVLWDIVDEFAKDDYTIINMVGTGHEIKFDHGYTFLSTIQLHGGMLVFHIFYKN